MHTMTLTYTGPAEVRFALYDYAGRPTTRYIARASHLPPAPINAEVGHHVMIIDRSGSMGGSPIEEAKTMLEKVATLAEYGDSEALMSLISYSSSGDVTVHFARQRLVDVCRAGSPYIASIRTIRATYLTCVSQALDLAETLISDKETTGISVHTDGFFNDSSPMSESRKIDAFITRMRTKRNVFVNTIAYGWADTCVLLRISNALSGKCVQATSSRAVYDALADTTQLLAGRTAPPVCVATEGADYQALVSVKARRVNGTTLDLRVTGLREGDDAVVWRYRRVSEAAYDASTAPVAGHEAPGTLAPVYALARAFLAEGRLGACKGVMRATRNVTLLDAHLRALTTEQRAQLATALDALLYEGDAGCEWSVGYGVSQHRGSIMGLVDTLGRHLGDWTLNLPAFLTGYQKRGLKRVPGVRVEEVVDGVTVSKVVPPKTRLEPVDDPGFVSVSGFALNNSNASLQMLVSRDAVLIMDDNPEIPGGFPIHTASRHRGHAVRQVAGKKLALREHRNYTLVGDGVSNARALPITIASKTLHAQLVALGALRDGQAGPYSPNTTYVIRLDDVPVLAPDADLGVPAFLFEELLSLQIQASMLRACLPDGVRGELWTEGQLEDLRVHDLTSGLNYSPKTTTPYASLEAAIRTGHVDSRVSVSIELMNREIAGASDLYSANAYLQRRFTVTPASAAGRELAKEGWLKKATMVDATEAGAAVRRKVLTPAVASKLSAVDEVMMPYFEMFFGMRVLDGSEGMYAGASSMDREELARRKMLVDNLIETLRTRVRPLVFYVGATGVLPDSWGDPVAMTADALMAKYPTVGLSEAQREGTFFEVGATILAVYTKVAYYSTPAGVAAAWAVSSEDCDE